MSIADKITRLSNARDSISAAITAKGGTVTSGDGFEDFARDIATITGGEPYTGVYKVTPTAAVQTLETEGKTMTDDVTVNAVPYAEASNPAGGKTVSILS